MRREGAREPVRRLALGAVCALLLAGGFAAVAGAGHAGRQIARVMGKSSYDFAEWGLLELNPRSGRKVRARQPAREFIPGSVAKLFTISAAWNTLGPGHRFTTPVFALGTSQGSTLNGNLVLQAQGDLTMGGRTAPNGKVSFRNFDHLDANELPHTRLTPENPLAGLNQIAEQVRAAGLTQIRGDVVIDDRLWEPDPQLTAEDPGLDPMIINDNVIDVSVRPTLPGEPARVSWRPQTAAIRVESQVTTGPRSTDPNHFPYGWQLTQVAPDRIVASGTIPANAGIELQTSDIGDPASFARTALIEALSRAGVSVSAASTVPNPAAKLPPRNSYTDADRVAAYRSPPYRQYARLILKVSHNLGAQVSLCQLAVHIGSNDCQAGFAVERPFLKRAGVSLNEVALSDGRGGSPSDRTTPRAVMQLLRWWMSRRDFNTFRRSLPILGIEGSLARSQRHSPSRGEVFAKTGTAAGVDNLNNRLVIASKALAGYLYGRHGRLRPFVIVVNGGFFPMNASSLFEATDDLARIAAVMQQAASSRPSR
jgi:D-alanyl-D-alanine carboxypeptidase/D-alanyl-D-alanine-endopeptidase (penicillin-binding protein 4)